MSKIKIRLSKESDHQAIVDIYNEAILQTTATFDTEIKTVADQNDWFKRHGGKYPIFVAEIANYKNSEGEIL